MSSGGCLPLPRGYIHISDLDSNIFFSETAWSAILYMEHHQERRLKVKINGSGHVTKKAAMAINIKNLYKSYSSEPEDL